MAGSGMERRKILTVLGLYLALVAGLIQSSTISTLLPVAAQEIGGIEYYSLCQTMTGMVSIVLMPLAGYFAAKNPAGKRTLYAVMLLVGAAVIFARALAPSMLAVVIPAGLYGCVSAGNYVLGYSLVRDLFDAKKAAVYLGVCGTVSALGMLIGPAIGGFLMDAFSWRMLCHAIWPLLVLAAVLVLMGERTPDDQVVIQAQPDRKFDAVGAVAVALFLFGFVAALSLGSSFVPFGSAGSNALFVLAAAGLALLVWDMRAKRSAAFIPTTALGDHNTLTFAIANYCTNFSNMAVFFFLPMYLITAMGLSAAESGLTMTMYSIAGLFLGPVFGRMIGRSGTARGVLSFGCVVRIAVAVALLLVIAPGANVFAIYVIMLVAGVYSSVQNTAFSAGPQVQLADRIRVQANSLVQMGQNLGGCTGTAVYTAILGVFGVVEGMPIALGLSVVMAVIGLVFALRLRKLDE